MIKNFEAFQTNDLASLAVSLNKLKEDCSDIKVLSVMPAMTALQQTIIIAFVELTFSTSEDESNFNLKYKKGKLNVVKP